MQLWHIVGNSNTEILTWHFVSAFDFNISISIPYIWNPYAGIPSNYTRGHFVSNFGFNVGQLRMNDVLPTNCSGERISNIVLKLITKRKYKVMKPMMNRSESPSPVVQKITQFLNQRAFLLVTTRFSIVSKIAVIRPRFFKY